jgi:lipoate-protein ligase A
MRWLWLEDAAPGAPDYNMAADAALFEAIRDARLMLPVLRVYRWDRPSVSIGRLQDEAAVRAVYPSLPIVRRPTGGRAVLHGFDLTITIVTRDEWLPATDAHGVLSSYRLIVSGIVSALRAVGHDAVSGLRGPHSHSPRCFDSVAACDVADSRTGRKLLGSAQRRERGAILQQMDIPEEARIDAPAFLAAVRRCVGEAMGVREWVQAASCESVLNCDSSD